MNRQNNNQVPDLAINWIVDHRRELAMGNTPAARRLNIEDLSMEYWRAFRRELSHDLERLQITVEAR